MEETNINRIIISKYIHDQSQGKDTVSLEKRIFNKAIDEKLIYFVNKIPFWESMRIIVIPEIKS